MDILGEFQFVVIIHDVQVDLTVSELTYLHLIQAQLNQKVFLQVSSATATFAMTFSSSMSVVEYYLLKRFPIPYGNVLHLSITFCM